MTPKRRAAIPGQLRQGHQIIRFWRGPSRGGYLAHELIGIKHLRESEVAELRREGLIIPDPDRARPRWGGFAPLKLKESADGPRPD